jgi:hypothetical protein
MFLKGNRVIKLYRGKDMQTKSLLRKGLVIGIIILLGTNILPLVTCAPTDDYHSIGCSSITLNVLDDYVNWTINGTMGNNGWYISPLNFSCTYNHTVVAAVYSNLNGLYTGPFTVYTEGRIDFYWWWVDYQGTVSGIHGPYVFGIDDIPPTINFTVTALNCLHTKWLLTANVSDATSGVAKVEFYVDDVLIGNVSAPGPYMFIYHGKGRVAQAIVYDFASNYAMNPMVSMPLISQQSQSQNNPSVQQKTMLFRDLIYNLLLHHQMKGWNQ